MPQKISYSYKITDPVIDEFSPNGESSYLYIYYHSSVTFVIRETFKGFSNTSHVHSLDRFRRSVFDKVKSDICILQKVCDSKVNNMKIKYAKHFIHKLGMGDPTTFVYQFIYDRKDKITHR